MIVGLGTILAAAGGAYPHPVVSTHGEWAGVLWLIVGGLFLAATVIGPIVRANMPDEVTPHSHDEPPGSSHQHGPDGTQL
jgi:hypothetical protein